MLILIYILILIMDFTKPCFLVENFKNYSGEYFVYVNDCVMKNLQDVVTIKNYNGQILKTSIKNYNNVLTNIKGVSSETIIFNNVEFCDIANKLNLSIKETEHVGCDVKLYNCYTNKLDRNIVTASGKVNIQIAIYSSGDIYVGYPFLVDF